jgi:hypothetical protein
MKARTLIRLVVAAAVLTGGMAALGGSAAADTEAGASFNCDNGDNGGGGDVAVSTGDDTDIDPNAESTAAGLAHFAAGEPGPADCDNDQNSQERGDSYAEGHVDTGAGGNANSVQICSNEGQQVPPRVDVGGDEENTGYCTAE